MLFNSLTFAVFFPLVVVLYFLLPARGRVPMLLVASCVFYMAFIPAYLLILFVTILIDYFAGIQIERRRGGARKALLAVSIVSTCAVLFVFKYYNFFVGSSLAVAHALGLNLPWRLASIILPIGLSFHTFQSLSYVVEVYRGQQKAESNFVVYATYVMFFPQLVAGPIERPQNLLHQFYETHRFDYDRTTAGLKRITWGLFKKVVVADRLALYVNDVYGAPRSHNGLQLTIATFFFAYQIYCDFSGYTDIALGSASILGFRLMENFDTPYYSTSISEFWRRWHISLSTWFRDYVYFPLGGNRVPPVRWAQNIMITFMISGLWHGANWTYVIWGCLHGFYLLFGRLTAGIRERLLGGIGLPTGTAMRTALSMGTTFALVLVAWIFFRAKSVSDGCYVMTHLFSSWDFHAISTETFFLRQMPAALGAIAVLEAGQFLSGREAPRALFARLPVAARWACYYGAVVLIILFGVFGSAQFIYFQF